MKVEPYLCFEGRCEEAIEFYKKAVGAEVTAFMRFKDMPETPPPGAVPPGSDDKIMHSALKIGNSVVMMSDGGKIGEGKFDGISLAISVGTEAEADNLFAALADGGQVIMPLCRTFWSPKFGMTTDKFGVTWMVGVM